MSLSKTSLLRKTLTGSTLALSLLAASVQAQTINLSYNGAPDADKNAVHVFASNLKTLVEEKTDGELELKLYPNSMLGEEQERMEQVISSPSLNIASFAGMAPIVPEVYVSATPFMFDGFEDARRFFDEGQYWQQVQQLFSERANGAEILAVVEEGGFLAFTNDKRPITSPDDFEGLRFRAMDPSQVALYEAFGASGTPIPWTEVYMALRTGVADGQMNPPMYILLGSLQEVQKYLTLANIQYSDQFLVANGQLLESLSEEERTALLESVKEANAQARQDNQSQVESRIASLEEQGMQVIRPSEADLEAFRIKGQPAYLEWLKSQDIAPELIDTAMQDAGISS
ncbi:TRAP transporter substrate-binding protein DctP [Cobetia sp. cqz5-12]|uniref:TRAP transporter substrate-binding protein DctP n=1 Tax=Cobetia sp. cqz5-12 TaxID=2609415 RepID=UPI001906A00B|nr:TRAP transporter substrate-binding protein DctP [Cobetia sp. cqz5-12]QQK64021.1 TRAP transporter substrate-binding protein DctP [Cobetia sp. cqz5-12]